MDVLPPRRPTARMPDVQPEEVGADKAGPHDGPGSDQAYQTHGAPRVRRCVAGPFRLTGCVFRAIAAASSPDLWPPLPKTRKDTTVGSILGGSLFIYSPTRG